MSDLPQPTHWLEEEETLGASSHAEQFALSLHEAFWDLSFTGNDPEDQRDTTVPSTLLRPATITLLNHTPERRSKKYTPTSQEGLHKMSALALSSGRSLQPPVSPTH